jgi:predicted ATPase/class 3 adenylate cyclase
MRGADRSTSPRARRCPKAVDRREARGVADKISATQPDRPMGAALPSGTVTLLFTDIAGSTRLLQNHRQSYAALLAVHRRLLRAAFAEHGGHEVDTQGDSFFIAFPTAGEAVAAAAQAQRALASHPWPDGVRVSVRMGLHSGEATVAGDSYVGLAVHRAARIAAAATGGQVLLSGVTAALLDEDSPDGTALRHLGDHRLKDFPEPAPLYQLDIAGLPQQFPPLPTTVPQHRLPVPTGALLGRDGDVEVLTTLLRDPATRLVTVTGPGGVGKSRFALDAAQAVADAFPGGAVFVPLSPVTDPELVLSTIADAVGARLPVGVSSIDALRAAIGDDRTLLVLDNFEQVVRAGGDLAALLDGVPAAVALVTSRQTLRLRSEHHFPLAPLSVGYSQELFAERAAAVDPHFTLDPGAAAAVAEISRLLDGIPLAIELAAARVRLLPPAALLARLGRRLDVLTGGPVDLPARQRTLRATMDWSFDLLGPYDQAVFVRLAVFAGGFTLDAAEAVCGRPGEPDILESLSALLDASLLVRPGDTSAQPRLDMLETVRAYATEKLVTSPDRTESERRHTEWVWGMTEPVLHLDAPGFRDALQRLDRDRANLRAAVHRAIDDADVPTAAVLIRNAGAYLVRRDAHREVVGWLDQILPQAVSAPAAVRGRVLVLRAFMAATLNDVAMISPLLAEAQPLLPDESDYDTDRAFAALAGALGAMADNSLEEASRYIDEAASRFAAAGQVGGVAFIARIRGHLALRRGDLEGAEQHYRAALELGKRVGDETQVGHVLSMRGMILLARGDPAGGRRSVLDGAAINRRSPQPSAMAFSLEGLAAVALTARRPAVAARALAAAAAARRHIAAPFNPALAPLLADVADRARGLLGDEEYEAACAEGSRWPLLQALDRTLTLLDDADPASGTEPSRVRDS